MKPVDAVIIVLLFLLSFLPVVMLTQKANAQAVVQVKELGKVIKTLPLDQNAEWTFSKDGEINKLEVKNKAIHVYYANCPDKLDVKQGWVKAPGKSIVCLPHALTITIVNGGKAPVEREDGKVVDYGG
jgi:hypothetical protein